MYAPGGKPISQQSMMNNRMMGPRMINPNMGMTQMQSQQLPTQSPQQMAPLQAMTPQQMGSGQIPPNTSNSPLHPRAPSSQMVRRPPPSSGGKPSQHFPGQQMMAPNMQSQSNSPRAQIKVSFPSLYSTNNYINGLLIDHGLWDHGLHHLLFWLTYVTYTCKVKPIIPHSRVSLCIIISHSRVSLT